MSSGIYWWRFAGIIATAIVGIGGAWSILSADQAPVWLVAGSGVIGLAGVAAAGVLAIWLWLFVSESLRPSVRLRKPVVEMALAQREGAMVGRRRYRLYPIRFWGVLTFGRSAVFGLMLFDPIETIDFKDEDDAQ